MATEEKTSGEQLSPGAAGAAWGAFYDGAWQEAGAGERFEVLNPATGRPIGSVAACGEAEVDAAVSSAKQAFESDWRWRPPQERSALMRQAAAALRSHAEEIGRLTTLENGKPYRDALYVDVNAAAFLFDHFAGLATTLTGEIVDQGGVEAHVLLEPYGVVGAIIPFNWPPAHFGGKCAPALATGNTVVLKPGDQAPLAALRMVEIVNEVLPPGVLNAVPGPAAGPPLAGHREVSRVSFTGSTPTGRKVLASLGNNFAMPSMELGGKNPAIVFEDADVEIALKTCLEGAFFNKGEACTATSRILVHESRHDELLDRFAAAAARLVVGDGLDPETDIGPVVDERQRDRIESFVEAGPGEGARLVMRGEVPSDPALAGGFWVPPTVFADVEPGTALAQEEIFGPVACFMKFGSEEEAIGIANDTDYGLTAAIVSEDLMRAQRVAERLEAGLVFVNNYDRSTMVGTPFGGVKDSGFGREHSLDTMREFVRAKNVRLPGRRPPRVWSVVERVLAD